eukprot:m.135429 g.135429  ORF g.135429 m.135429 type:complete len:57 (-) comp22593_c1_seq2:330-500(-)
MRLKERRNGEIQRGQPRPRHVRTRTFFIGALVYAGGVRLHLLQRCAGILFARVKKW